MELVQQQREMPLAVGGFKREGFMSVFCLSCWGRLACTGDRVARVKCITHTIPFLFTPGGGGITSTNQSKPVSQGVLDNPKSKGKLATNVWGKKTKNFFVGFFPDSPPKKPESHSEKKMKTESPTPGGGGSVNN